MADTAQPTFKDGTPITQEAIQALEAKSQTREGASLNSGGTAARSFGDPPPKLNEVSDEVLKAELKRRKGK